MFSQLERGKIGSASINAAIASGLRKTTVAVANTGTPDGKANITGQVTDANGKSVAGRHLIALFIDNAAYGDPEDLGTLAAKANSRLLKELTDDALAYVLTHSDGSWGVELTLAANGTVHAHAAVAGTFATANAAITGVA